MATVVAVADLHGNLPLDLPGGDVLVIAGDVCPIEDHLVPFQDRWLRERFYPWLGRLPHAEVVWIAGNHDFACAEQGWEAGGRGHYLLDDGIELLGLSFYGFPWVPNLPMWAFHRDPEELDAKAALIPRVDVLVCHGPPSGYGDALSGGGRAGSAALAQRLRQVPPRLCVFGHIHEAHGRWRAGPSTLANVAYVDDLYEVRPGAAQVFEL